MCSSLMIDYVSLDLVNLKIFPPPRLLILVSDLTMQLCKETMKNSSKRVSDFIVELSNM